MKKILLKVSAVVLFCTLFLCIKSNVSFGFEREIEGSTGWSTTNISMKTDQNTSATVLAGKAFLILNDNNDGYWRIEYNGQRGYIQNANCMINLPDVEPSIVYNITNASQSIYRSSGYNLPDVTGKQLYNTGKVYNSKIEREEYVCPVLYSTAKMIATAQELALKDGNCLKIYDSYRPNSVTKEIRDSLNKLYNGNSIVRNNILYSYGKSGRRYSWGQGWFLAQSVSSHNVGAAIDVTLCKNSDKSELIMPTAMHELSSKAIKYYSGNVSKIPSNYSKEMTEAAKTLDTYFTKAGMTTLASEWWHFQDQSGLNRVKQATNYQGCDFQIDGIVSKMVYDVNGDGKVDTSDASAILTEYSKVSAKKKIKADLKYDVNGDGIVNSKDASLVLTYYSTRAVNK